jgi:hypothetical protein
MKCPRGPGSARLGSVIVVTVIAGLFSYRLWSHHEATKLRLAVGPQAELRFVWYGKRAGERLLDPDTDKKFLQLIEGAKHIRPRTSRSLRRIGSWPFVEIVKTRHLTMFRQKVVIHAERDSSSTIEVYSRGRILHVVRFNGPSPYYELSRQRASELAELLIGLERSDTVASSRSHANTR